MSAPQTPIDAARLSLLLNELRLPAIKVLWPQFAETADKEGWPDPLGRPREGRLATRLPVVAAQTTGMHVRRRWAVAHGSRALRQHSAPATLHVGRSLGSRTPDPTKPPLGASGIRAVFCTRNSNACARTQCLLSEFLHLASWNTLEPLDALA